MKTLRLIIALLAFNSCGSSSSDSGPAPTAASSKSQVIPNISTSYYVSSSKDLKACDDTTRGFLAYIEDAKKFQACLSAGWTDVNVNGKDGAAGTNGTMVSGNEWYDPITTKMWVMTTINTAVAGWSDSQSACTGSYRMPTGAEITLGLTHGMKAVAQALTNAPTFILASGGGTYVINTGLLGSNTTAAQFCIAN